MIIYTTIIIANLTGDIISIIGTYYKDQTDPAVPWSIFVYMFSIVCKVWTEWLKLLFSSLDGYFSIDIRPVAT